MDNAVRKPFPIFEEFPLIAYQCVQKGVERKFIYLSPMIEKMTGYPAELFLDDPRTFFRTIHEEDRNTFLRAWEQQDLRGQQEVSLEYRVLNSKGEEMWIREHSLISRVNHQNEKECQGLFFVTNETNSLRSQIGRWDRELQVLTESLPDWVGRVDPRFRILYLNKGWENQEPVFPEQYIGKSLSTLGFAPTILPIIIENLIRVFSELLPISFEVSHALNQETKFYEFRVVPEKNELGEVETALLICRDITNIRASQLACKDSEEKFRQLAETVDSVFWIWDGDRKKIVYISPAYEKLWGGNAQQLLKNPNDWLTLVVPEDRGRVENLFLKRLDKKSLDIEYRMFSKEKQVRWVHNRTFPMSGEGSSDRRIIGIAQDVTERKYWEEERLRSAKLESLGLLAGGLAHDFNNLLTAILGQVSLAKYGLDPTHPLYVRLTEAENASLRAQEIAKQLLTFSKGGSPVKKVMGIGDLIEENVRLVLSGSNVRPVFDISPSIDQVSIDAGQICQVLHNLVINARQAMLEGGECLVRAYNMEGGLPTKELERFGAEYDRWVRVDVIDQGIGIPEGHLGKIFDPYFTTKSSGSGLGLATSYSIIRNHGGILFVTSEVNKGSIFSFILPSCSILTMRPSPIDEQLKKGEGEILIMDDEAQIRRVLAEMVETCGYGYQTARDGQEALQLFTEAQKKGSPFSAVILDLTVPGGMGGKDAIQELMRLDPEVKAIVVSGYSNDPVLAHYQEYGFSGHVAKPFNLLELSVALSSVLQNTSSS